MSRIPRRALIILLISEPLIFLFLLNIFVLKMADPSGLLGAMLGVIAVLGTVATVIAGVVSHLRHKQQPEGILARYSAGPITITILMVVVLLLNL
jgi:hypothetical protein